MLSANLEHSRKLQQNHLLIVKSNSEGDNTQKIPVAGMKSTATFS